MSESQRKRAMRRLLVDQEELRSSPVENVSAVPLESDMFEWHCNIRQDDIVYHIILFVSDKYPFHSPSAEFVPKGFRFHAGATMPGNRGEKVCLNIFSDFAMYHANWAQEKGFGWSPGYSIQTVLMNLVAFLAEGSEVYKKMNADLCKEFTCPECGHTSAKPYPPMGLIEAGDPFKKSAKISEDNSAETCPEIIDYISKERFVLRQPTSPEQLFGYGLVQSGPTHRPSLTTPCEFLTGESFFGMMNLVGSVQSSLKETLKFFLPLYIHPTHGSEIKDTFESTLKSVAKIFPKFKELPVLEDFVLKIIPNLMASTVVEFSKGTQHTSDNHLTGYFALHRLLLWALETYPVLQSMVDANLKEFFENEDMRSKTSCPHIGEWLMLLSASERFRWQDASDAYLQESFRRNVMWYVKEDENLGYLDTDIDYRLKNTFERTEVSRKILAFQVMFLDIAMPKGVSREDVIQRYDKNYGFPTQEMVAQMKVACHTIQNHVNTYPDWFKILKLKPYSQEELFQMLKESVEFSIVTDGYHWSLPKTGCGWKKVLAKYKKGLKGEKGRSAEGKPETSGLEKKNKVTEDGANASKLKKEKYALTAKTGRGKGRGKNRFDDESSEEESIKDEEEKITNEGRGRGRGQRGHGRSQRGKRGATTSNKSPAPTRKRACKS